MDKLSLDQKPEGWGPVAPTYGAVAAPFMARFAPDALRLADVHPGQRVLDVAAGTGALSFAAAERGAQVLATDFAPEMIDYLRTKAAQRGVQGIDVAVMDGQALEVEDDSFDAAVSLFGLMFFPDRAAGFRELYRVIRPGGRAAVDCDMAVFSGVEHRAPAGVSSTAGAAALPAAWAPIAPRVLPNMRRYTDAPSSTFWDPAILTSRSESGGGQRTATTR